eukprot:1183965-Prorocentrum_minimum.AAC.5
MEGGEGVEADLTKAWELFTEAADQAMEVTAHVPIKPLMSQFYPKNKLDCCRAPEHCGFRIYSFALSSLYESG